MPGTTGDIIWRRTDPKTVELYNTDRGRGSGGPDISPAATAPAPRALAQQIGDARLAEIGAATTEAERQDLIDKYTNPYHRDPDRRLSADEKKEHKKRLKDFMKYWKSSDPTEFDPTDGIQELLDGGIMWHDADGWGTYSNLEMSKKDRRAFIGAADAWGDRVGAYNPDGSYNPDAVKTYWAEQQQRYQQEHGGEP